jgi:hypothetical protein
LTKRKNYDDATKILQEWLDKCNVVRLLNKEINQKQKINTSLKNNNGFLVLENLKIKYRWLYDINDI